MQRLAIILMAMLLVVACGIPAASSSATTPAVGENGYLHVSGGQRIPVAATLAVDDAFTKAANVNDTLGIQNMMLAGQIFNVEDHTGVLVLDQQPTRVQVRILDGVFYGRSGWVNPAWVNR